MRIKITHECIACGLCFDIASQLFEMNDPWPAGQNVTRKWVKKTRHVKPRIAARWK